MDKQFARQFQKLRVQHDKPRAGFHAYIAVWRNSNRGEVIIGAPTVEALTERWLEITRTPLEVGRAQHITMTYSGTEEELAAQAAAATAVEIADE